jgi:PPOX class probable F420-dependent enzyme
MTVRFDDRARALVDGRNLSTLTTLGADGAPQTTVVFVRRDGDTVLISTVKGRVKARNMARDPRVSLLVLDAAQGRWVQIRGRVDITDDPEKALMHEIYTAYMGAPPPPEPEAERLVVRIVPETAFVWPPAAA